MSEKAGLSTQAELLQMKYVGTGHADITKQYAAVFVSDKCSAWLENQHRDTLASYMSHPAMMEYISTIDNVPSAMKRYEFTERMAEPCGPPPQEDIEMGNAGK